MNGAQVLVALAALVSLVGCANTGAVKPPTWLSGSYEGTLSAPAAVGCGLPSMLEPFTWTISVDGDDFLLVSKSPYGNTFTFKSKLRSEGEHWLLSGSLETTSKSLGNGTFVGRLYAADHGVIFAHSVQSATNPDCHEEGAALAGARDRRT
ncbi:MULTISPECIES: hypothetical protein [unclassified Rhodanobacter]|uniref:Lipoprotein n=1 Tax=Rhodanobacter humi TaxID=1888173 RepID=A0ABV4AUN6_9GAMM